MKIKKCFFMLICSITFFIGCNKEVNSELVSTEINFTKIGEGALYGGGKEGISKSTLTISNIDNWNNLISKMNSVNNVSDNFTETDINFNEFTVIAIFLEIKGSAWGIRTEKVTENQNNITISTKENSSIATVITQPFTIIKIPKTNKTVIVD